MNENWSKSEKLLLGKWTDGKPELPEGLGWAKLGLKYLGVFLGDKPTAQKKNQKESLKRLRVIWRKGNV